MILNHWRPPAEAGVTTTNFGDELNTVLWPRLLGDSFFDDDDRVAFLGIGSLLGWPKQGDDTRLKRILFGTGAIVADAPRREPRDARWHIYCVRGPLTAQIYGLDEALALTDPAILVADFHHRREPTHLFGYMPHYTEAVAWSSVLAEACADFGVRYIDPREDVESTIEAIGSVSVMIAEAMHGAIVADALRVPWIAAFTRLRPDRFKWTDWCRSMEVDFDPRWVGNLASLGARVRMRGTYLDAAATRLFRDHLRRVTRSTRPVLSGASTHAVRLEQLHAALAQLRLDVSAGQYISQ